MRDEGLGVSHHRVGHRILDPARNQRGPKRVPLHRVVDPAPESFLLREPSRGRLRVQLGEPPPRAHRVDAGYHLFEAVWRI